jgi:hypothetical protein
MKKRKRNKKKYPREIPESVRVLRELVARGRAELEARQKAAEQSS